GRLHRQFVVGQAELDFARVGQRFQDVQQLARGDRGGFVVIAHAEIGMRGDLDFEVGGNEGDLVAFLAHEDVRQDGQGMASFDDSRHGRQRFQQCIARGLYELHVHPFRVCSNTCRVWLSSACLARASEILRTACSTVVWSRPPNKSPISGRLFWVSSLARYMATWRGKAILAGRRFEYMSATLIL